MGKLVLHIVFLFTLFFARGQQNLVPNGSFEEYNWCPNYANGFYINASKYWTTPSLGSPDYFNSCSTEYDNVLQRFLFSVPENYIGYQVAYSGNAYAFLGMAQNEAGTPAYVEYIQIKLDQVLQAGRFYKTRFFVCNPSSKSCVNSIGALFTQNQLNLNTDGLLPYTPQIQSDSAVFFCDTANWYEVQGEFMAQGNEQYLTIGVFEQLPQIDAKDQQGNIISNFIDVLFYIDDVSVTETEFETINIFTPNSDGVNDVYYLNLRGIRALRAEIYNRWGNVIVEGTDSLNWDGTYNGVNCSKGVYFLRIQFENNTVNGFIHLVR